MGRPWVLTTASFVSPVAQVKANKKITITQRGVGWGNLGVDDIHTKKNTVPNVNIQQLSGNILKV